MTLLLVDNIHLYKTPNGEYYTPTIYNEEFFSRYLSVFSEVRVVAKTKYVESIDTAKYIHVKYNGVKIIELPWYKGIRELIKKRRLVLKAIKGCPEGCDCTILRSAQIESFMVYLFTKIRKRPFALEVVNDPQSFSDMNILFRTASTLLLKRMCIRANGVAYVTEKYLQSKYPCKAIKSTDAVNCFTGSYSSIGLDEKNIHTPKTAFNIGHFNLIHVANVISGKAKGHLTVIDAVKVLNDDNFNVHAYFVGDGESVKEFIEYSNSIGIGDLIHFVGRISDKDEYMSYLGKADLFIFPSYYEGLPRVVIEAMACGLPCIASPAGGTAELLKEENIIDAQDAVKYAQRIKELIDNPDELYRLSSENIETARKFEKKRVQAKRECFYKALYKEVKQ